MTDDGPSARGRWTCRVDNQQLSKPMSKYNDKDKEKYGDNRSFEFGSRDTASSARMQLTDEQLHPNDDRRETTVRVDSDRLSHRQLSHFDEKSTYDYEPPSRHEQNKRTHDDPASDLFQSFLGAVGLSTEPDRNIGFDGPEFETQGDPARDLFGDYDDDEWW